MRNNGRWHLNDAQRFAAALTFATALFLAAMSAGLQSLVLLVVAAGLVIAAALGIFLLGLRYNTRAGAQGKAYVIEAPPPPIGKIVGRCELRLLVDLPGTTTRIVKYRDASVPTVKWPHVGTVLPIDVDRRNPRQLRVRWDLVDPMTAGSRQVDDLDGFNTPFYTDYVDATVPSAAVSSTSPLTAASTAGGAAAPGGPGGLGGPGGPGGSDRAGGGGLELVDDDYFSPPAARAPVTPIPPAVPGLPAVPAGSGDAAVADDGAADDGEADDAATAAGFELPMRVPQPRPAEPPIDDAAVASPSPRTPPDNALSGAPATALPVAGEPSGVGSMLVVSNLNASVAFYTTKLSFSVLDTADGTAVLEYGGSRVVLQEVPDMPPVDRRVVHLHIPVPDVDAAYQRLKADGVGFVHRPQLTSRGDKVELWAATLRDPDGHAIALIQWRDRQDTPR